MTRGIHKKRVPRFCFLLACLFHALAPARADDIPGGQTREVRGVSMAPLVKPGEYVEVQPGYYAHNEVRRGDLVAYRYSGDYIPLLKQVRALPGDTWDLVPRPGGLSGIAVNGRELTNSIGQPYAVSSKKARKLELYIHDYPRIPPDTYLILGEEPEGTVDSTEFGLVSKSDILGKVSRRGETDFKAGSLSPDLKLRYIDATPTSWTCTIRNNSSSGLQATVSCSGTEIAVGGGCVPTGSGSVTASATSNGSNAQGWTCQASSAGIEAYANCCK